MEMNLTISGKTRNFFRVFLMSLLLGILMLPAEAQNRVTVSGRLTDTGQNPLIGAIGTRFYELPITPEQIAMAVAAKQ